MAQPVPQGSKPYIPASKSLPELTLKAIVLGIILAAILGGANAYIGLKIGQTITACIPAAVMSMAILGLFKKSNILENNIVQTMASAGEVVAAATIFTLPALLVIGYWKSFSYFDVVLIIITGGLIGVLFSIPLRHALIVDENLAFPEGVATAEVLKAGDGQKGSAKILVQGGLLAALVKLGEAGLQLFAGSLHAWTYAGGTVVGFGTGLAPVMLGAGYIIGARVCLTLLVGAVIMWGICIPLAGLFQGLPEAASAFDAAIALKSQMRYIGVGAMIAGGASALIQVLRPIRCAISKSCQALMSKKKVALLRTEKDIPFSYVLIGLAVLFVPVYFMVQYFFKTVSPCLCESSCLLISMLSLVATFLIGFLAAAIGGYMAGLVGSSSNPLSGVLIACIVLISCIFLFVVRDEINFQENDVAAMGFAASIIMLAAVIGCIGSVSCDNLQDLKSGHVLGSTPWKQQVALCIGVVASAFVMGPVMQILFEAYGMAGVFPREGMDAAHGLSAPQAMLIATVTKGMIGASLPLDLIFIGVGIAIVAIFIDRHMKKTGKGAFPPLAIALGLYLPLEVSIPMFFGGLVSSWAVRKRGVEGHASKGILFASGLIAGEALMGIFLAVPFATFENTSLFRFVPAALENHTSLLGVLATGFVAYKLFKIGSKKT